jgi:hypothetical protein
MENNQSEDQSNHSLLPNQGRVLAFDVDRTSLDTFREALPGWQIDNLCGATVASLPCDWNPGAVDLLVVGVRASVTETLGLCRFLAFCTAYSRDSRQAEVETLALSGNWHNQARRVDAPLLVLVPSGQRTLVGAVLETGAQSCLMLPIHANEVANMVVHAHAGNQPGRHTLNLDQAQGGDRWRDDGGQG